MKHLNLTIIALFLAIASFAQVGPISGPSSLCVGQTGTYTDPTTGGTWTCASPILSIGITTGIATGISAGTTTITYTVGAYDTVYSVSVAPLPAPIGGPTSLCVGSSISATDTTPGGTWTITPMTHAVVDMSGLLTGVASGVSTLYYTSTYGCIVSETITVNPMPTPITGTLTVCAVSTTTLSSTTPGGVWVSTAPVVASVGSASGVVTGNAPGYTNINYVLPATGCQATSIVTVTPASPVYAVTGGGSYCSGGAGVPVGLANSIGASSYQLYLGITAVGAPVSGTGSAISFGPQTAAGVYTVVANPGTSCASAMWAALLLLLTHHLLPLP